MNILIAVAATIADAIADAITVAVRLVIMIDRSHIVIDDRYINLCFFLTRRDRYGHSQIACFSPHVKTGPEGVN